MVGFGKTLWSAAGGETEYGIKAMPLGGYIRMVGMVPPGKDGRQRITTTVGGPVGMFRQIIEDSRAGDRAEVTAQPTTGGSSTSCTRSSASSSCSPAR